jgi:RNA polymerase sigma-70 factor (ECF subfamily)
MARHVEYVPRKSEQSPMHEVNYAALTHFVRTTLPPKLRRQTDAEDILQETFIEAWQCNDSSSDGAANSMVWLRTVAKRKIIDCARRCGTRKRASDAVEPQQIDRRSISSSELAPSIFLEKQEAERILSDALSALSVRHRNAILLRFFDQLSYSDVAKELEISPKAAQMLVKRATVQLRRIIGRQSRVI